MFLEILSQAQRESFLVLATRVMMADGEDSADEFDALDAIRHEMALHQDVDIKKALGKIDVAAFDTHKARVVAALELLRLVYADDYVHEAEIAEVRNICAAMGFPEDWVATMGEWAARYKQVEGDANEGEMADYRDALVAHAHQMMEM